VALLGNLTGSSQYFSNELFYNGVATTSLRLDKASSGYLYRTPSGASNRRTFTIAYWYKTSIVFASEANDQNNPIFYADEPDGGGFFGLNISGQGQGAASDTVNELTYYDYDSGDTTDYSLETNSSFGDPSAWYHVVWAFDTTQGTEANRVKVYINGVQRAYTDMNQHHAAVIQNRELNVNQATPHWIGRNVDTTSRYMNGYLADFNFIDGTQYDASYFGEFKNGIWIPKEPSVTYGTNGFRLQFKNTSVGSGSSSTIGADTSGNNNHFTSSGIAASDCAMPDSPENNFATLNSISEVAPTLSEGNLAWTNMAQANTPTSTFTIPSTGKWYWEVRPSAIGEMMIGVQTRANLAYSGRKTVYYKDGGSGGGSGSIYIEGSGNGGDQGAYTNGDIIAVLYNADDMEISWRKNNTQQGLTFDVTDTDVTPIIHHGSGSGTNSGTFNFGQDSSFAGTETAQGNTDGNGIGDFYYAPPSGYLALCTANLPEPTIGPNSLTQADDHFNTVTHTSVNEATSINVGFRPDWIWAKSRNRVSTHILVDSTRGVRKYLSSHEAFAEKNSNTENGVDILAFTSTGFDVPDDPHGYFNYHNGSSTFDNNVFWNWKANGGTTSSNTDGDVTSTVQANTDAGFSIVTWTQGSGQTDVGHGLGAVPEMIIGTTRTPSSGSWGWHIFHKDLGVSKYLFLNANTAATSSSNIFNPVNSTVFGSSQFLFQASTPNVAYCFNSVEGYSKIGSYTGNGSADGTFVYTGFRPAWVMLKNTARGADWRINDSTRQHENNVDYSSAHLLLANSSSAEITNEYDIDFLSNGFKLRSGDVYENGNGEVFIYMAFAEAPFKYANAR